MVHKSQSNLMTFHALKEKLLILYEATKEECLRAGRHLAIKRSLEHFQADMEMLFLSITKKLVNVQSVASMYMYKT